MLFIDMFQVENNLATFLDIFFLEIIRAPIRNFSFVGMKRNKPGIS